MLAGLVELGVSVCFISNSSTVKITNRLDDLLAHDPELRARISIESDAAKFSVQEIGLGSDVSEELRSIFAKLPAGEIQQEIQRPIYLRRGRYFEALCKVWKNDASAIARTLVCGDVWELDLAMPRALG